MYLALFLTPWMVAYALSSLLFNHHQVIRLLYEVAINKFETVEKRKYERRFHAEVTPVEAARQILRDLDMDGAHFVRGNLKDRLTIQRQEGFVAQRVIYFPLEQRLRVGSQRFTIPMLLQKIHLRAGYSQGVVAWLARSAIPAWALAVTPQSSLIPACPVPSSG